MKRVMWLVVVVLMAGVGFAWWMNRRITIPFRGFSAEEVFVDVPSGASVMSIGEELAAAGVVADPWTFRLAAKVAGAERGLQAGEYRFREAATARDVVARLARGDVFSRGITFPEGLTIREMAAIFGREGFGTAAEFERAARDATLIAEIDPEAESLEGYLFPDTYALGRRAGAPALVEAMVAGFRRAFDSDLRTAASTRGWSAREAVTLASLIEKETAAASERPTVAAVYHNRLDRRMPLQCDPTVIYALMQAGRWRGNLTRDHLQIDSRYNTYRYPGLPPGPIASPGRAALEAAVRPADAPYLYFVSRNDGTHAFATTLAEHNRNVQRWQVQYFQRGR